MSVHHAVVLEGVFAGDGVSVDSRVCITERYPDAEIRWRDERELGIALVREIQALAYQRPAADFSTLCIVLAFTSATTEAQNALLKILEDPPATTQFVLCVPSAGILLPTILSRVAIESYVAPTSTTVTPALLTQPVAAALADIESRHKAKDVEWFRAQHAALIAWRRGLYSHMQSAPLTPALHEALGCAIARMNTRGASNRWLLEHVVLSSATHGLSR